MDFDLYDHGYRLGVFDKCNGRPARYETPDGATDIYIDGYLDGFVTNEVQINNPNEPTPGQSEDEFFERRAEEASGAGETFANKTLRPLIEAQIVHLGYEDEQREYFWEGIFDQL